MKNEHHAMHPPKAREGVTKIYHDIITERGEILSLTLSKLSQPVACLTA